MLPAGLSLNGSTGVIDTPTTAVSSDSITFKVADSSSPPQSDQAVLDMTIQAQQLSSELVPLYTYSASYDGLGNVSAITTLSTGSKAAASWGVGPSPTMRLTV